MNYFKTLKKTKPQGSLIGIALNPDLKETHALQCS